MLKTLSWLPPLAWAALIFHLSSRTVEGPEPWWWFAHADKVIHAGLFGILSGLLYVAIRRAPAWPPRRAALAAFAIAVGYGISDEIHQRYTPTRSPDVWDAAADSAGASAVFLLAGRRRR